MDDNFLKIQNPWWQYQNKEVWDSEFQALQNQPYFFNPSLRQKLVLEGGDIHIIRGPRQVGKTTLLKFLIQDLLSKLINPHNIFYLSCESLSSFKELEEILLPWLQKPHKTGYLFLDEISFVREWQRAILAVANMGLLRHISVVLTGSNAKDLKESGERLPGRRGKGKDHTFYPLALKELKKLPAFFNKESNELLQIYLTVGGFPQAIKDYLEIGSVRDTTYETYRNWIIGDAHRYELRQETLKQILFRISETISSRLTWPKLIENSPVKSHETALEYVEHLEDAFLCHVLHCYDPNKEGASPQKARKIYFIDPLLYSIAATWQRGFTNIYQYLKQEIQNPSFFGKLFEAVVVSHYKRHYETMYFWYSSQGDQEVDLVLKEEGKLQFFDIKSQKISPYKALNQIVSIIHPETFLLSHST